MALDITWFLNTHPALLGMRDFRLRSWNWQPYQSISSFGRKISAPHKTIKMYPVLTAGSRAGVAALRQGGNYVNLVRLVLVANDGDTRPHNLSGFDLPS